MSSSTSSFRLLIRNARQIVQVVDDCESECLAGDRINHIKVLESEEPSLAVAVASDGLIAAIGQNHEVEQLVRGCPVERRVDAAGGCILPGFVDAHSHPVFAGDRVHEFALKMRGATYMEVQAAGGGIHFTTRHTREADEDRLLDDFLRIGRLMLTAGTTTLEAKSGYGLETETELKMLRVLDRAAERIPLEISATFCGAHAVPKDTDEEKQTRLVIEHMLPAIRRERHAGKLKNLENVDVFCEKNVFGVDCTRRILEAGAAECGLHANFHAEELTALGGAEMGASIKARAMSHLEEVSEGAMQAMAASGSVAVLLPATALLLRLRPPPYQRMIEHGCVVALGSDFNPNSFCYTMPTVLHLACATMRMSVEAALVASTLNAAHSLGRGKTHGAVAVGRRADLILLAHHDWRHIVYRLSGHTTLIRHVYKNGLLVYDADDARQETPTGTQSK